MTEQEIRFADLQNQFLANMELVHFDQFNYECEKATFDDTQGAFSNALSIKRHNLKIGSLAANQVGYDRRVISIAGIDGCLFNPILVYSSEDTSVLDEVNVSYPGLKVKIKRSNTIRIRYQTFNGERVAQTYNGLTARAILHAIDQLDGVCFINRANRIHRERALRQWKRFNKHNAA